MSIEAFKAACVAQLGCPYTWPTAENAYSGKGLVGCDWPEGRDCSGFVSIALKAAGYSKLSPAMWNAQKYGDSLCWTHEPQPGDLVLYGTSPQHITHIEVLWDEGLHIGAIGGDHTCLTPDIAHKMNARVQFRKTARSDLLGYLKNPLRVE